ncbi:MAG: carboxylating nicotinate-nucleotide diphosphorylase [Nitrospiraceae bacterium]
MSTVSTFHIREVVRTALQEDLALGDATTSALFAHNCPARGRIVAQQDLVAVGIAVAIQTFLEIDSALRIVQAVQDGASAAKGSTILTVEGDGRSILTGERIALNFLQHLSGIASLTAKFCQMARGYPTTILDTRKTTPGLRTLEKWAVALGGGKNHRRSLGDGLLIKDNHLTLMRGQGLGLVEACRLARNRAPHGFRIIVEVESVDQVEKALQGGADVILLDNMDSASVRRAVERIKGRALVEVSGGITLQNVREMAAAGADFISIGALTHSAPAADISLDVVSLRRKLRQSK